MTSSEPLLGLAQVNITADNVAEARDWYSGFFGKQPYFQRPDDHAPDYVEFRLGASEDEFGIISRKFMPPTAAGPAGAIARWHVDDLRDTVQQLLAMGAKEFEPLTEREGGFATASVIDPFGNILGLIHSPHFASMLEKN